MCLSSIHNIRNNSMKHTLSLLLLLIVSTLCVTRNHGISDFTTLQLRGPFTATLTQGSSTHLRISADSNQLMDLLTITSSNDVLSITLKESGDNVASINVEIGTNRLISSVLVKKATKLIVPSLRLSEKGQIEVRGVGTLKVGEVQGDKVNVVVDETSKVEIHNGKINKLTADVRGVSKFDALGVKVGEANVGAYGVSKVFVDVAKKVDIKAEGISEVTLKGEPEVHKELDLLSNVIKA